MAINYKRKIIEDLKKEADYLRKSTNIDGMNLNL